MVVNTEMRHGTKEISKQKAHTGYLPGEVVANSGYITADNTTITKNYLILPNNSLDTCELFNLIILSWDFP